MEAGSQPGLLELAGFRVDWVLPGQFPNRFLLRFRPIPCLGWLNPGQTRRIGPDFKSMVMVLILPTIWLFAAGSPELGLSIGLLGTALVHPYFFAICQKQISLTPFSSICYMVEINLLKMKISWIDDFFSLTQ